MKLVEFKLAHSNARLLVKSTEVAAIHAYDKKNTIIQLGGGKHVVKGDIDYVVGRLGGKVHTDE